MSFTKKTILVVDSSKTFILYMGIMLKRMGFNVVPADGCAEALNLMKIVTPDLVVMDSFLPSTDGFDTLRRIRRDEHVKDVPVVIMMARADADFERRCSEAGCNGYLPKPVPMDLLHDHIQEFIFSPLGFRRRHLRVQAEIKLFLTWDDVAREYRTETVSEGGVYLKTDSPFKVGKKVGVTIQHKSGKLSLEGVVIYTKGATDDKAGIPPGMAVEFKNVSARDALVLNRFVSELIAGDITDVSGRTVLTMPWRRTEMQDVPADDGN